MRPRQLCQPALARWLYLEEQVQALELEAKAAEASVTELRRLLSSGNTEVKPDEFNRARATFDGTYAEMQQKRLKATVQNRLLEGVRQWIESLPANTKLAIVHAPINGASLEAVRSDLKDARTQLKALEANPCASHDIEARVRNYVGALARLAAPEVTGYAQGYGLQVKFPGDPYDPNRGPGLLLCAALDPGGLTELILGAIERAAPMSANDHAEKIAELQDRIAELSYMTAALIERHGGEFDPDLSPRQILGVKFAEAEEVAA